MAGYVALYCIGGLGGFGGADGVNPIQVQILVGAGNRELLEPHHVEKRLRPMGQVQMLIAGRPGDPASLVDACSVSDSEPFLECPPFEEMRAELKGIRNLDFHLGAEAILPIWPKSRTQALPVFRRLIVFRAESACLCFDDVGLDPPAG